ncbi:MULTISPECIES: hypothetical protein [Priestia]|uniref:Uncharacterized protein n=1 Tax=Priestia megaterium TaxID=1404 RepID=A0AAX6BMK9_PRIMG|nr:MULTISPECIES: hypothetical protein [Priestia]MED3949947.1 hypothetical protein [Priestia aryabhattai]NGY91775.1 hypothetical protein [Priestia megaterium]PEI52170.1 hypothetical protein CN635_23815 [Priestia aryabhattai]QFY74133.1 hypothetical protein CEQ83_16860 [Priestia megaterium]GMG74930.1 hypothetical protein ShirakiTB12_33980 [Priestia megaterium]
MKRHLTLLLSLCSSLFIFLLSLFQWDLDDRIGKYVSPYIWLFFVLPFFLLLTLWTLIYLFSSRKWLPLVIQVITVVLWFFIPSEQLNLDINFKLHQQKRKEVAANIQSGVLKADGVDYPSLIPFSNEPDNSSLIDLPKEYASVSRGRDDVAVETKGKAISVLFFTSSGLFGHFSGFVYDPKNRKPSSGDFGLKFDEIEKIQKNWYYISY